MRHLYKSLQYTMVVWDVIMGGAGWRAQGNSVKFLVTLISLKTTEQ